MKLYIKSANSDQLYEVTKWDLMTGAEVNYGEWSAEDVRDIIKGYKVDPLISDDHMTGYSRNGSNTIYFVSPKFELQKSKQYKRYVIEWFDDTNKLHSKEFKLKKSAERFASNIVEQFGSSEWNTWTEYDSDNKITEQFHF